MPPCPKNESIKIEKEESGEEKRKCGTGTVLKIIFWFRFILLLKDSKECPRPQKAKNENIKIEKEKIEEMRDGDSLENNFLV